MSDWCWGILGAFEAVGLTALLYLLVDWLWRRPLIKGGPTNRWILITGCDTGLGNAAAKHLDAIGCRVIAGCLTPEGQSSLRQQCSSRLVPLLMDITSDESVQAAFETVSELLGPNEGLWGLVNNAGISGTMGPVEWLTMEQLTQPFQVNTQGMIRVIQTFLPLLKRNSTEGSRLVNVASILGRITIPYTAAYAMSKHAIEALSDALRLELAPFKIRVSVVEPGGHPSNLGDKLEGSLVETWNRLPESTKRIYGTSYRDQVIYLVLKFFPMFSSSTTDGVTKAYKHALFSCRPRQHYLVGLDAILMGNIGLLHTSILDTMLSLPGLRAIPAGCK